MITLNAKLILALKLLCQYLSKFVLICQYVTAIISYITLSIIRPFNTNEIARNFDIHHCQLQVQLIIITCYMLESYWTFHPPTAFSSKQFSYPFFSSNLQVPCMMRCFSYNNGISVSACLGIMFFATLVFMVWCFCLWCLWPDGWWCTACTVWDFHVLHSCDQVRCPVSTRHLEKYQPTGNMMMMLELITE